LAEIAGGYRRCDSRLGSAKNRQQRVPFQYLNGSHTRFLDFVRSFFSRPRYPITTSAIPHQRNAEINSPRKSKQQVERERDHTDKESDAIGMYLNTSAS